MRHAVSDAALASPMLDFNPTLSNIIQESHHWLALLSTQIQLPQPIAQVVSTFDRLPLLRLLHLFRTDI